MRWAAERDYIVLTADLDFSAILAATARRRPSVILVRSDILTPEALGGAVLAAIHKAGEELITGAIVSVDAKRARLRVLPLEGRES
jgi:predicted nuclease of predicted toxin-antitoxin system